MQADIETANATITMLTQLWTDFKVTTINENLANFDMIIFSVVLDHVILPSHH